MTNKYEEALEWFNRGWAQNTNREADAIRRALTIAAKQGEKDRVMKLMAEALQLLAIGHVDAPEVMRQALSQYKALEEE